MSNALDGTEECMAEAKIGSMCKMLWRNNSGKFASDNG